MGVAARCDDPLEGLFEDWGEGAIDWLCMLTINLDESLKDASGMYYVAGFMGNQAHWREYVREWRGALKPLRSIHVSELRLNSQHAPSRYKEILKTLGAIPGACGLTPVFGSICRNDYAARVAGTELQILMEGYVLAILALMDGIGRHLPRGERLQVFFEARESYAAIRDRAMIQWRKLHKTPAGWSVLERWGSIPKGTLTEAADYLCYAMHQRHADRDSQKARLTAPILATEPIGHHTSKEETQHWLNEIHKTRRLRRLTPEIRKALL